MTKALDMEVKPGMDAMHVIVDGEDVTPFIRTPEVSGHVSEVSAIGGVRTAMVAIQRRQAEKGGIVLDGRDIGTTVLPNADVKIFLTAGAFARRHRSRCGKTRLHGQSPRDLPPEAGRGRYPS